MPPLTIAPHYTCLKADLLVVKMLATSEKLNKKEKERLSRFLKYTEYLLNKTYWYQSVKNKDLENDC